MEIRIGKPGRTCASTARQFEHGESVVSVMRVQDQQLVRQDFSKPAWEGGDKPAGAIAVWQTQYADPSLAEQEPPEKYSPLRKIFYDAVESEDRIEIAKAFLAAQLLRRQKVFRLVKESDEQDGNLRVAVLMDRLGNRLVEAKDPHLTYAEMETARVRLMQELNALEAEQRGESSVTEEGASSGEQQ